MNIKYIATKDMLDDMLIKMLRLTSSKVRILRINNFLTYYHYLKFNLNKLLVIKKQQKHKQSYLGDAKYNKDYYR